MKVFWIFTLTLLFLIGLRAVAQDDMEKMLNDEVGEETNYATATFKATRVMNGQSIERMPQGQLDFRIHHRFSQINSGAYNFFGLDGATTHFSLEYGIKDWVMVGVGRGNLEKTYDGFAKFSIWRQSTGKKNMPVSISYFTSVALRTEYFPNVDSIMKNSNYPFTARLAYVHQVLIARKFNKWISLQVSPTFIHYNLVKYELDPNNIFAVGLGGRVKLTNRISVNCEYFYLQNPFNNYQSTQYHDAFSVGFDIETGGHVFQLLFTNADGMIEKDFIGHTSGRWNKGDIHFGFNISRVFDINHHH
jgi:hypothetical protein